MKVHTWLQELKTATPSLCVVPHQRVHVVRSLIGKGYAGNDAVDAEGAAMQCSLGRLKLYMSFVQRIMAARPMSVAEVERLCRSADAAQSQLSSINIKRDTLVARLRGARFECPEVPETTESSRRCPVCGGDDLRTLARQTRSADEGQTIFYLCANPKCNKEFR